MTSATLTRPTTTPPTRSGSVRILRDAMAAVLGEASRTMEPTGLAYSGSLLVSITSETRRGPVTHAYRVETIVGGLTMAKADCSTGRYEADCGTVYTLDTTFGGGVVRCDCEDARRRMHCARTGSQCKHRKAAAALGLVSAGE